MFENDVLQPVVVIHGGRMIVDEALARMREAATLWSVGRVGGDELIYAACGLLVAGFDGCSLAMLAGVHVRRADEEIVELLEPALDEVGLRYYPRGSRAGQEAAVRLFASRVLAGTLAPRELTGWAHSVIGHDGLEVAERFVELDDVYDMLEYAAMTEQEVDGEVVDEARRIIGESEPHSACDGG